MYKRNPLNLLREKDFNAWFWLKIDKDVPNGCWHWTGTRKKDGPHGQGYGQVSYRKKLHVTHRIAWDLKHGKIKKGLFVLHKCDNRICCNPDHLFLGTKKDNTHDMMDKGRQCAKLTPDVVAVIRHACKYEIKQKEVAAYFGVSRGLIGHIIQGRNWVNR